MIYRSYIQHVFWHHLSCKLRNPFDPSFLENNVTHSIPFQPNLSNPQNLKKLSATHPNFAKAASERVLGLDDPRVPPPVANLRFEVSPAILSPQTWPFRPFYHLLSPCLFQDRPISFTWEALQLRHRATWGDRYGLTLKSKTSCRLPRSLLFTKSCTLSELVDEAPESKKHCISDENLKTRTAGPCVWTPIWQLCDKHLPLISIHPFGGRNALITQYIYIICIYTIYTI